jgi:hypothetical protein
VPKPRYHAAVSLALAAAVVVRSRDWRDALPVLVAGVLVDLDHLADYALRQVGGTSNYLLLPLHAWELVLGLLVRGTRVSRGLAGGLAGHLALDQWNACIDHPLAYWILFRARHGFRATAPVVDRERFIRESRWMDEPPRRWL